ncbi:MAG: peptidylprolyl isomerase [Flavobacteriales bacterium]|nr:peptidylprolyl isomerase [Flavobacteriales bacterium]
MKFFGIIVISLFSVCAFAQVPGKVVDRIIGVVGNETLLQSELESAMLEMSEGKSTGTALERCNVLENLMYQKLLLNQAKLDSVEVTDGEVQAQVEQRLDYFIGMFGSVEEFEKYYGKTSAQLRDEYFDMIKDQMLVQRMQDQVAKGLHITPADVTRYFNTIPKDSIPLIGEQIEYSKIAIDPQIRESERNKVIHRLDSIRANLVAGKSSMTLEAAKWSEDPGSRYKGGCYPLQRKGTFVPEYEAAVYNTPEGSYSTVFSSVFGYHFVKVIEKRGEMYESCHILMSPKVLQSDLDSCRLRLEALLPELRNDTSNFARAAIRYSTDKETKNQGGRVINPATGGTKHEVSGLSSELNLMMMGMKPGQISDPVLITNQDGTQSYVVYRLDRRIPAHSANLKDDYEIFRRVAEADARQKVTDKWVKKKIATTAVNIHEDFTSCPFQFPWVKSKL